MILLRPGWLAALPLLALAVLLLRRRGADAGGWETVMPPTMLAGMMALGHLRRGSGWRRLAPVAGAAVLALGLAGPALPRADAPVFAQSDAVVIAIDMSDSVAAGPALADAQAAAAGLLTRLAGRPVGLILYANEAYAVAAPTDDPATLQSQIAVLDAAIMPDEGSHPAAALSLAGQMLAGLKRADLVLISDGGGIDAAARAEAARLAEAGVRISVLSVEGEPSGDAVALRALANGAVAEAGRPGAVVAALAGGGLDRDRALVALQYRDLGPWLAALALLPLAMQFRRQA
ncbi:VWA domain-containing protein [Paracoccus chinensis]|uniref:Ca-activated chloride channel family protein n=1 Tax=Paracoccus chinensis TaxID=525640 RepID=A0A1G9LMM4_9RHOB|nr:VWA domain-containing protein [Paracoccus chinensis]SDL63121.1 Ca-activated chloride channel family protein [Paracoccus chinensis]